MELFPLPSYEEWRPILVPVNTRVHITYPGGQDVTQAISSMGKRFTREISRPFYPEDASPPIETTFDNPNPSPTTIQIEGLTHTADSAFNYGIWSQTLAPGNNPRCREKCSLCLAPFATALFAGTHPVALHARELSPACSNSWGQIYTADSRSRVFIGSQITSFLEVLQ